MGVYVPLASVLLANVIMYAIVMRVIWRATLKARRDRLSSADRERRFGQSPGGQNTMTRTSGRSQSKEDKGKMWRQVRGSMGICFLLGLTWTVGLAMISNPNVILQWVFTILNSLQGFAIFLFYTVAHRQLHKELRSEAEKNSVTGQLISALHDNSQSRRRSSTWFSTQFLSNSRGTGRRRRSKGGSIDNGLDTVSIQSRDSIDRRRSSSNTADLTPAQRYHRRRQKSLDSAVDNGSGDHSNGESARKRANSSDLTPAQKYWRRKESRESALDTASIYSNDTLPRPRRSSSLASESKSPSNYDASSPYPQHIAGSSENIKPTTLYLPSPEPEVVSTRSPPEQSEVTSLSSPFPRLDVSPLRSPPELTLSSTSSDPAAHRPSMSSIVVNESPRENEEESNA